MLLLSTTQLRLQYFRSPGEVEGGYAILSHVWVGEEQSFQDINMLIAQGIQSLHHKQVSEKIRGACRVAHDHGYRWIWIDTCCIDKTSSAELSEAINSMFQWYALSSVCYAYLDDVPSSGGPLDAAYSPFRLSRWFTRGWTLQELIAPRFLLFMSSDWIPLGTKALLADVVESVTAVDASVLTFARDISDISIARRMSWAAKRDTTRIEDEAYCLMGIFGVNMSTLYGEGREAFRRLQEEILKRSSDHSLFAWGLTFTEAMLEQGRLVPDTLEPDNFLFAPSPAEFLHSGHISGVTPDKAMNAAASLLAVIPKDVRNAGEVTITSYGVRCHLLLASEQVYHLAVLACQNEGGECIALLLRRRQWSEGSLPQHYVGASFLDESRSPASGRLEPRRSRVYRLMAISSGTRRTLQALDELHRSRRSPIPRADGTPAKEFYIMHRPPDVSHPWMRLYTTEPNEWFIPPWVHLGPQSYGFQRIRPPTSNPNTVEFLVFDNSRYHESFTIHLGHCGVFLWATVTIRPGDFYAAHTPAYNRSHSQRDQHDRGDLDLGLYTRPHTLAGANPAPFSSPQYRTGTYLGQRAPANFLTPQMFSQPMLGPTPQQAYYTPVAPQPPMPSEAFLTPLLAPSTSGVPSHTSHAYAPTPCSTYHISTWKTGSMTFGDHNRTVQLTFTRYPTADSYCLEIGLKGDVYHDMLLAERGERGMSAKIPSTSQPIVSGMLNTSKP